MRSPLPSHPEPKTLEESVLSFWKEQQIFAKLQKERADRTPFVIYDGPPTANAAPALHHTIPGAFKDLMGRFQTMRGHYVPGQAGWDTHGLPVEVQVEKKLGLAQKSDILSLVPGDERASIEKFNEMCRTSVWEFKQEWDVFVEREAYWTDQTNPYITYDASYVEGVWGVLKRVFEKDLVYKGYKVVPYCTRCGTALSAAEVGLEYQNRHDTAVYVTFPLVEMPGRSLLVWTTTPWTIPANVAVAVHPEARYVVVKTESHGEVILNEARKSLVEGEEVASFTGAELAGLHYEPMIAGTMPKDYQPRVITSEVVTDTEGSGLLSIAPAYGEEDNGIGMEQGLPTVHVIGLDGHFMDAVEVVAGQQVHEGIGALVASYKEAGRLFKKESYTHSYPHCWRCKQPLVYYAKDSWYIAVSTKRDELVAANNTVQWMPKHIQQGRFGDFISQARDWAISRERFWGTPLPLWVSETGEVLCIGSFDELRSLAKNPELIGEDFNPHRPYVDDIILVKDGQEYRREPYVMDVWFDSGAMPYASGRLAKDQFPAAYIAEAVDQTRGWFYSLLVLGVLLEGKAPYERVVCMGHLVDEHGKKMSKSVGNVIKPSEVFDSVGVDAMRWFYYSVNDPGETKSFSLKEVQTGYRKTVLLVWNMLNFLESMPGFVLPTKDQRSAALAGELPDQQLLDHWVLALRSQVIAEVTESLESMQYQRAARELERYINELSTWYLRRSRKRDDAAFPITMAALLFDLVQLLAPFMPYSSEFFFGRLRTDEDVQSVHMAEWPVAATVEVQTTVFEEMGRVREIIEAAHSLRASAGQKLRQPLAGLATRGREIPTEYHEILLDEVNVKEIVALPENIDGWEVGNECAINVTLTPELIREGEAREFLRHIQMVRKSAGLRPGQEIVVRAATETIAEIEELIAGHDWVAEESFVTGWEVGGVGETKIAIGDRELLVSVVPTAE